jgi:hypothetical protein
MKTYIVYVNGIEVGYIKAGSHNVAEKKAQKKWGNWSKNGYATAHVSVTYTEV